MKFTCEKCGKSFPNAEECTQHEQEHVDAEAKRAEKEKAMVASIENIDTLYAKFEEALNEHEKTYGTIGRYIGVYNPFSLFGKLLR